MSAPLALSYCGLALGDEASGGACPAGCTSPAGAADDAADTDGELAGGGADADDRGADADPGADARDDDDVDVDVDADDRGGDAITDGTGAAAAELAAAPAGGFGATAAPPTGLPWLGVTVITTTAAAAANARTAIAPVIIPVRKLISSSRALMAARMPDHEPALR